MALELYVTRGCASCAELREQLLWDGRAFVEYDVEDDAAARARLLALAGEHALVPVLVEDGALVSSGWQGRGCYVGRSAR
ncbi:MAG TPA: glutaredoxin domain-containing protein [Candidatus Limnocylindria bacterium]|jgi:mycoredoxin|nr:glutaredoxin domain-containing protein [Candidatus Limnocylindria bacterium]